MKCIDKICDYREFNTRDDVGNFYYCKYVGIEVDRGNDECLLDRFNKENEQSNKINLS